MCQSEILKILENTDKWLSRNDFEKELLISGPSIAMSLKRLRKYNEVKYKLIKAKHEHYLYHKK